MNDETGSIAETLDLGDAGSILRTVEQALLVDPVLRDERPWQGFIVVASFDESGSAVGIYKYDGILTLPGAMSMRNPAFDEELVEPLRALTQDDADQAWRTWLIVYDDQAGTFAHSYLWPGQDARWNVLDGSFTMDIAAEVNPVDLSLLETPFSAVGAHWLHARYARKHDVPGDPIIKAGEFCADRLAGGWRIYLRSDGEQTDQPLESIDAAAGGVVFLVSDSTAVTHTSADVNSHEGLLAEL